jgi:hypothetical protein
VGKTCGVNSSTDLNCYKNAEFSANNESQLVNAIGGQCVYEKSDQTLALRSCVDGHYAIVTDAGVAEPIKVRGDETDLWIYDKTKKILTNSHSARCLGSGTAPPSPGPAPSGNVEAFVTAEVNGETLYAKVADGRYWSGKLPVGAAFIGTGVHFGQFDDFAITY